MRKVCVVEVAYEHLWLRLRHLLQKPAGRGQPQTVKLRCRTMLVEDTSTLSVLLQMLLETESGGVTGCKEQHCHQAALETMTNLVYKCS